MNLVLPLSLALAVFGLTSCSAEKAERPELPAAADWKNDASVLTIGARDSPVGDDGTYFRPEGDPSLTGSIFEDLISCDIRRFEVNRLPHMHGANLQIIIPRDAYLLTATRCLQRNLPPGIQIQVYDWRTDSLNKDIQQDSARANAALHAYRQRNGLGPEDPIDLEAEQSRSAQPGSTAPTPSTNLRAD